MGVEDDADYVDGGRDETVYRVQTGRTFGHAGVGPGDALLPGGAALLSARQVCTSRSEDTQRLYYSPASSIIAKSPIKGWKLKVGSSAQAPVP